MNRLEDPAFGRAKPVVMEKELGVQHLLSLAGPLQIRMDCRSDDMEQSGQIPM
jgi:hypothetical protein